MGKLMKRGGDSFLGSPLLAVSPVHPAGKRPARVHHTATTPRSSGVAAGPSAARPQRRRAMQRGGREHAVRVARLRRLLVEAHQQRAVAAQAQRQDAPICHVAVAGARASVHARGPGEVHPRRRQLGGARRVRERLEARHDHRLAPRVVVAERGHQHLLPRGVHDVGGDVRALDRLLRQRRTRGVVEAPQPPLCRQHASAVKWVLLPGSRAH